MWDKSDVPTDVDPRRTALREARLRNIAQAARRSKPRQGSVIARLAEHEAKWRRA